MLLQFAVRLMAPVLAGVLVSAGPAFASDLSGLAISSGPHGSSRPTGFSGQAGLARLAGTSVPPSLGGAGQAAFQRGDLRDLSLEQLMSLEVTSVSKRPEARFNVASAIHVLGGEEIRRAGARSIPEALRLVPGLHVARVTANTWAIAARGFNGRFANKLLVLIDGRSVYTPLFSGVYWEVQGIPVDAVDRIEVILGPGGSIWGSNAVNGVINILTRPAGETQGVRNTVGFGTEHEFFDTLRYGGRLGDDGHYRVFGRFRALDEALHLDGSPGTDDLRLGYGGFRIDWGDAGQWTVSGDAYVGRAGRTTRQPTPGPPFTRLDSGDAELGGGNATVRWTRALSPRSETRVQGYYERYDRVQFPGDPEVEFDQTVRTFDLEVRHAWTPEGHEVVLGGNVRATDFDTRGSFSFSLSEPSPTDVLGSFFMQDRMALLEDRLLLTLGTRLEGHSLTGLEVLPAARAAWLVTPTQTAWGAVSRAVRIPSRSEYDAVITVSAFPAPAGGLALVRLFGDDAVGPERLIAYEVGYRVQAHERAFFELAAFYNDYSDLLSLVPRPLRLEPGPSPRLIVPSVFENALDGSAYGAEATATLDPSSRVRLELSYSHLRMDLDPDPGLDPGSAITTEGENPTHQAKLLAFIDLPAGFRFDGSAQYVDALESIGVPSHTRLDLSLGWRLTPTMELALVGQDLLEGEHLEFRDMAGGEEDALMQRGVYASFVWSPGGGAEGGSR